MAFKELENIDRTDLVDKMEQALPLVMDSLGLCDTSLSKMSGISQDKIRRARSKKSRYNLKWSEYLTLLFIFWNNDKSRYLVEKNGLFPKELKDILSTNRNAHSSKRL